ncbi:MAG TPA: MucR family transcriptional regulator [Azospirillum sp.]|nr:MucR family transcriptional regulator [Azospirillum sp.]
MTESNTTALTAAIVAGYVSKNAVAVADLPNLINTVRSALDGLGKAPEPVEERKAPAVPIRKSVTPDYIVCLEDGRKLKMLKRYLMSEFGLTPDQYRQRWNLPRDYPMTAPNYAAARSALAVQAGLGRNGGGRRAAPAPEPAQVETPAPKRGRRKASA